MNYIDTYLKSTDKAALEAIAATVVNHTEVVQGAAASKDDDGNEIPAKGDPAYWYMLVRAAFPVPAIDGVELCDEQTGSAVCGVWA